MTDNFDPSYRIERQEPSEGEYTSGGVRAFIERHPTALIIGAFIILPFIVFGIVLLILRVKNGASSDLSAIPTPTISIAPTATSIAAQPTLAVDTFPTIEPTDTPTKKPTAKPTAKPSTQPTSAPTATVTPQKKANLYFHYLNCNYVPTASGSAETKLDGVTFASAAEVPSTALCSVVFQNNEDVRTGEIWYRITSGTEKSERAEGTLGKGNYSVNEFKEYKEVVSLQKTTGEHEIRFELNYNKLFEETSFDDNTKVVKYTVK